MPATVAASRQEVESLIAALQNEAPVHYWNLPLKSMPTGQRLLQRSGEEQRDIILHLIALLRSKHWSDPQSTRVAYRTLSELLRLRMPFRHDELVEVVRWYQNSTYMRWNTLTALVTQIKQYTEHSPMTPDLRDTLARLVETLKSSNFAPNVRRQIQALEGFVNDERQNPLVAGEAWSDQAIRDIQGLPDAEQRQWIDFLIHMQGATSSAPSGKWQKTAEAQLQQIGYEAFRDCVLRWFPLVDKPRTVMLPTGQWGPDPNEMINYINADILRGLAWVCAAREDAEVARALTNLALSAYRKVPGVGPRCLRVGNGCVWALGNMPGLVGVYQLALLQMKVKVTQAQKGIEKALATAAEREGLPRDELEELVTPAYGLTEVGLRREQLGDFRAELRVTGTHSVELRWFKADGKEQRSVPKQVKTSFAEELKELQLAAKDIQKMLPAQRDRIDNLYLRRKQWDFVTWSERYLDHPLLGVLARRLIWRFRNGETVTDAIWHDGHFVTHTGQRAPVFGPDTQVTLWHPIEASMDEIVAWRGWLDQQQIQQPFKQAHREIYILTDAERNTHTYSNRFAAHILRQHQFNGLCAVRGWRNQLRLMVDDSYPPAMKELPEWGLRAEFWVEGIGDTYGTDTNETGTYLRVATDQVRFYALDAPNNYAHAGGGGYGAAYYGGGGPHQALPLDQIPPLVFSEIMRDVDLFVGVASVGNDPNWSDGGPEGRYRDYWANYSFGDLSETAKTRKSVLERLVPRLKIANRCEVRDRFLVVRGNRRTYKIHLGSSNILMEPNDQYLCIVPGRSEANNGAAPVFLPFEGDRTLALILSKAFLLADDTSITDPTIVRQLER